MINWFKGLFGFPTKSEVIRDTILTLAKDRTLLESALSLSDEINRHKAKKAKPAPVHVLGFCVDATPRIAELAAQGMKNDAIARTLRRNGFFYESKNSGGAKPFEAIHVAYLINGRTIYNAQKKMYVSSDRYLQYQRDIKVRQKGKKK
jgi:hypothetical protein